MDLLHEFLSSTSEFDIIAITETSQGNNDFFKNNATIKGDNIISHLHIRKKVVLLLMQRIN